MPAEDLNGERSSQDVPTGVDHSLDSLAKDLANGSVSRRKALRLMGGALLGGTLASIPGMAWAKPKPPPPPGKKCQRSSQCPTSQVCVNGACACPSGTTFCGGSCVSNTCGTNETLNSTTCQCECISGATRCGDNCVSTCPSGQQLNTNTCQCECISGTSPCAFNGNGICGERADSSGTVCYCAIDCICPVGCVATSCEGCPAGSVCVSTADSPGVRCGSGFACVQPATFCPGASQPQCGGGCS